MAKPGWENSRFESAQARNEAVRTLMREALETAVAMKRAGEPKPPPGPDDLAADLAAPLSDSAGLRSAQAAELAFVLSAFCLAERRVLNLEPPSVDLNSTRLDGDRTTSESLSEYLAEYHIPASKGVLQSSTFRSGYDAPQARGTAQQQFLLWLREDGRRIAEVAGLFFALAREFADAELSFPELPALLPEKFTFAATRRLVEHLIARPSAGAYQQYLVAAFTAQEFVPLHPSWRVVTKNVGASDSASRSAGDVDVRFRHRLVHAIEVSENPWQSKIGQAAETARRTGTTQITVVAHATDLGADAIAAEMLARGVPPAVDLAVVDLMSYLDGVSSRLTPVARQGAVRLLYEHLVTWGRTRPDLVDHLVTTLVNLEFTTDDVAPEVDAGVTEALARLQSQTDLGGETVIEVAREDLTIVLEWVSEEIGPDCG